MVSGKSGKQPRFSISTANWPNYKTGETWVKREYVLINTDSTLAYTYAVSPSKAPVFLSLVEKARATERGSIYLAGVVPFARW